MELTVIHEQVVLEKEFKVYGTADEPLFLAKDVAEWIDYAFKDKNKGTRNVNMMLNTVDEDEKLVATLFTSGQNRNMWFLTEDGLYEVLMQSRKPIAKQFKKKVKQILKQIRQTGGYIPVTEEESSEEIMAKAVLIAQKTLKKKQLELEQKKAENMKLLSIVDEQEEIIRKYEALFGTKDCCSMKEFASFLGIGRNTLFSILRDNKILMKNNLPYAPYIKYFKITYNQNGYPCTLVTQAGAKYLVRKLTKLGYLD